eukprot:8828024-Pyramimonas_sp.AAC.1
MLWGGGPGLARVGVPGVEREAPRAGVRAARHCGDASPEHRRSQRQHALRHPQPHDHGGVQHARRPQPVAHDL